MIRYPHAGLIAALVVDGINAGVAVAQQDKTEIAALAGGGFWCVDPTSLRARCPGERGLGRPGPLGYP